VAPPRYKYGFLVVDVSVTRYSRAFRERESSECLCPASGGGFAKKGDRFDTRMFRMYRPCGDSPRLRMSHGAAASEKVHLYLAYRWFCRLGLEGKGLITPSFRRTAKVAFVRATLPATPAWFPQKSFVGPVDRNQRRLQRFCFSRSADGRRKKRRNRFVLRRSNEPAAILGNEWGQRQRRATTGI
jgi:hypothetical protein